MVKVADQIDQMPLGPDRLVREARAAHETDDFERVLLICGKFPAEYCISQYGDILASALAELGRFDEAITALDRYARASGDDCHAPVERLKLLYLAERWPEVVRSGKSILEDAAWFLSSGEVPKMWLMVAFAAVELGDHLSAWTALKEIGSHEPACDRLQFLKAKAAIRAKVIGQTCEKLHQAFLPDLRIVPVL